MLLSSSMQCDALSSVCKCSSKHTGSRSALTHCAALLQALENRTLDSKREMDIMNALDEMQSLNKRHERVDTAAALAALQRSADSEQARRPLCISPSTASEGSVLFELPHQCVLHVMCSSAAACTIVAYNLVSHRCRIFGHLRLLLCRFACHSQDKVCLWAYAACRIRACCVGTLLEHARAVGFIAAQLFLDVLLTTCLKYDGARNM